LRTLVANGTFGIDLPLLYKGRQIQVVVPNPSNAFIVVVAQIAIRHIYSNLLHWARASLHLSVGLLMAWALPTIYQNIKKINIGNLDFFKVLKFIRNCCV
jgi:hypothetical protein